MMMCHRKPDTRKPPELMYRTDHPWTPRNDIWMAGCTFLRLMLGLRNVCDDALTRERKPFASLVDAVGMPSNDTLSKVSGFLIPIINHQMSTESPSWVIHQSQRFARKAILVDVVSNNSDGVAIEGPSDGLVNISMCSKAKRERVKRERERWGEIDR